MDSSNETLRAEFELLRQEVIARYESSGMRVSGNWADSVHVEELPNGFTLVADSYINGRGPGKAPPSNAIEKWLTQKGIAARLQGEISTGSLAYLIARKIAREGWTPKEDAADIIAQVVTPQRIQQIMDKVEAVYFQQFSDQISSTLKSAFA